MRLLRGEDQIAEAGLVRPKEAEALAAAGLETIRELLDWFPRRYEDRRRFDAFPAQVGGEALCLRGTVIDSSKKFLGGKRSFYEVIVEEEGDNILRSGQIVCRWFNMPYIQSMIAAGHEVILYGKPKVNGGRLIIDHPEFEILKEDVEESVHVDRITPIYRNVSGFGQRKLRELIWKVLQEVEWLSLEPQYDFGDSGWFGDALREVHFPTAVEKTKAARKLFAREEFFLMQLKVAWKKRRHLAQDGRVQGKRMDLLKDFYESLPFDLTDAQKRCVKEIIADMRSPHSMNRLLQGDVGSGKTMVAICAMLLAVDSGNQAALMAPTQILAEQHYLTFCKFLEPLDLKIRLITGSREEQSGGSGTNSEADIMIGTHALLYDRADFKNLGCVVIDEQHKFGVAQRGKLINKNQAAGAAKLLPDVLVMTATPIPRTLTLTIYGDLDVSILDEAPKGRGAIVTAVRKKPKVTDVAKFLKLHLEKGRQIYLVYPLVEESAKLKLESAVEEHEKWQKRLKHFEVGLLHGKMRPEEKESVSRGFREGKIDVLVATTVIEVGVDVPNANVMVIHHADRYGLAQLHQLRGRIGRGEHKSYCILSTDGKSDDGMHKLEILAGTTDGFVIAEEDLVLRGPGDVMGTAQSGIGEIRFADFLADTKLISEVRQLAETLLGRNPKLEGLPHLVKLVEEERGEIEMS